MFLLLLEGSPAMADIDLKDRLREAFGEACPQVYSGVNGLSQGLLGELRTHQSWLISRGRFGYQVTWKNMASRLSMHDFSAEDFSQMNMENCCFKWSDLRCTKFAGAVLKNVTFENCDVEDADFSHARLENVSFIDCIDLDKAKFTEAILVDPAVSIHPPKP